MTLTGYSDPSHAEDIIPADLLVDKKPKYQSKGYGKAVAILITIAYLFLLPQLLKHVFSFALERYTIPQIYLVLGLSMHNAVYFFGHFIMYLIYTRKIPFFERYRVHTAPWPWESDPKKWKVLLRDSLITIFFAHFILVPYLIYNDTKGEIILNFNMDQVPGVVEIVVQLIIASIIEDTWFYWGHRLCHHKWIYPYIHKKHHSYTNTISITAEYIHVLEYFFVSILSTSVPVRILGSRMHVITYVLYTIFRIVESLNAHCGYDFSWSPYALLPFCQPSSWHNFHHSHNKGNYSGGFWDYICGTHKPYVEYMEKMKAKKLSQEKGNAKVDIKEKKDN